jgi:hypothetical protein
MAVAVMFGLLLWTAQQRMNTEDTLRRVAVYPTAQTKVSKQHFE